MDFEKLEIWRRSVQLSAEVYKALAGLRDFGFKDQITRSGLSVPSNIAEGMTRRTPKDKMHFLLIAKGSCSELRTQTYIGLEIGYIGHELGNHWIKETKEIASMISGLINKLKLEADS